MVIRGVKTIFVDTNILLTASDRNRVRHEVARNIFKVLALHGCTIALSGQVLREYLVVATRPLQANGLGMSVQKACENVAQFRQRSILLPETENVSAVLLQLIQKHEISGKRIHDGNIVATAMAHGIEALLTENAADFVPFNQITVITLADL